MGHERGSFLLSFQNLADFGAKSQQKIFKLKIL